MKTKSVAVILTYSWLILFSLIPLFLVFIASFLSRDNLHLVNLPFTLASYKLLLTPVFLKIFFRSLFIALLVTACCIVIAYPFSYLLLRSKHQSVLLVLIIIPFWTSSLIRTYSLIAILKSKGIINALLLKPHLIEAPITLLYTNFAVLIGLIYNLLPFMILPIFSNMERFDFRLIEAAKDLGANKWQLFFRVFLPNTAPGIFSGSVMVLLPAMTLFYIPNVLGGARSILLGNLIQDQFLVLENWPQGSATATLLTGLLLILIFCYRRQTKEIFR